jgi:8-oxo-dGTP pyrophosphatase MutT (NUDIX family)
MSDPKKPPGDGNPIQVLYSQNKYDNAWIRVVEHQIRKPSGAPGIYGVVQFKNRAVGVIPYENGRIWLVGQHRFALNEYSWEIPAGGCLIESGESLEDTARRELREETGFRAMSLEPIVKMHLSNSITDEFGVIFLARRLERLGHSEPEDTEVLQIKEVALSEAYRKVLSGEITDSLSVAGILRLTLLEREGGLSTLA